MLPEITVEDVAEMGINELIASYTITYDSGSSARASNIELCLDAINGTLLAPGETWDWNTSVGLCDESAGYKVAPAVVNGKVAQAVGGGIDDVATCLFNAVYEAGLAIGERKSLSMLQLH